MRFIYIHDVPHAFFGLKSIWTVDPFDAILTESHCSGLKKTFLAIHDINF